MSERTFSHVATYMASSSITYMIYPRSLFWIFTIPNSLILFNGMRNPKCVDAQAELDMCSLHVFENTV